MVKNKGISERSYIHYHEEILKHPFVPWEKLTEASKVAWSRTIHFVIRSEFSKIDLNEKEREMIEFCESRMDEQKRDGLPISNPLITLISKISKSLKESSGHSE